MSKIKKNKSNFKYHVLDLLMIGLILGLITFSWNTIGSMLFGLKEIGTMHSLSLVLVIIVTNNIYLAFQDRSKDYIRIDSSARTMENNAYIISSLIVGYVGVLILKLLITYIPI